MTVMVIRTTSGQVRRYIRIGNLVLRARDDAHPGFVVCLCVALDRRKKDHIIHTDHVGLECLKNIRQFLLRPDRRINNSFPALFHVVIDLLVR